MNLVIDIGNTQIKTAVFDKYTIVHKEISSRSKLFAFLKNISIKFPVSNAIVSNVSDFKKSEIREIKKLFPLLVLNEKTKLPFINKYKTPKTLGVDRIALLAAAVLKYPNENVLIFDAGTCITYDFLNNNKEYFGGAISPGIEMRYKSLNSYTANLPKLSAIEKIPPVGNSTDNAIHFGVLQGVINEIEGVIDLFKGKNQKLTVVLTGGDTIFLAKNIKSTIFANPNFLLEGLNGILIYNIYK